MARLESCSFDGTPCGHLGTRKGETGIIDSPGRLLDNALTNEQLYTEAGRHTKKHWDSWALS